MIIINQNKKYTEFRYQLEADYEKDIEENTTNLFGSRTVYIPYKRKINTRNLGASIPDGFLIDFSDVNNPEFYIVEIELGSHDFYRHIFPQITKFFAFFRNQNSRIELIRKIYEIIQNDELIRNRINGYIQNSEIFKFINDLIHDSQNILIVIDEIKSEFAEIQETYNDTWGRYVKIINIKLFSSNQEHLFLVTPEWEDISYIDLYNEQNESDDEVEENSVIDENYHLSELNQNVKDIYNRIRNSIKGYKEEIIFNPQRYYISIKLNRNIAFLKFSKKKLKAIIMLPVEEIQAKITNHEIKILTASVQKFYNGQCASVEIKEDENLDEVIELLKGIIDREQT